jgi:hypothetical protein
MGVVLTRCNAHRLQSDSGSPELTVSQQTLVRLVGERQHAQHAGKRELTLCEQRQP